MLFRSGIEVTLNTIWFQNKNFSWNTDWTYSWNRGGLKIESSAPRSSSRWNAIYAGGLVGYCEEPVYNSYNRGNISLIDAHIDVEGSSQGSVGGLVGKAYKLLWNSYSTGDVYSDVAVSRCAG